MIDNVYDAVPGGKGMKHVFSWISKIPPIAFLLFSVFLIIGTTGQILINKFKSVGLFLPMLLIGFICLFGLKIADQWEKAIVLRLGKFKALKGPGLFFVIPFVDKVNAYVDQRIRATDFAAETCLSKDTVPINVDAIAFWVIWDAEKAILEVQDYYNAIVLAAQTGLRDMIGKHELAELITNREELGKVLKDNLEKMTNPWGITIQSVEIRDVVIPKGLEDAMSRQAQAERERQARIILGTAETEIAEKFAEASKQYMDNPIALKLRAMNILYEGIKENASMLVIPSAMTESLDIGSYTGLAAYSSNLKKKKK